MMPAPGELHAKLDALYDMTQQRAGRLVALAIQSEMGTSGGAVWACTAGDPAHLDAAFGARLGAHLVAGLVESGNRFGVNN